MIGSGTHILRRTSIGAVSAIALVIVLAVPNPAKAWWRGGFFVGIPGPVVIGPPVIYGPPPVYFAPPPVYYGPPPAYPPPVNSPPTYPSSGYPAPQTYAAEPGHTCYAGSYVCPLAQTYPAGSACSCPTGRGPAYGQAR